MLFLHANLIKKNRTAEIFNLNCTKSSCRRMKNIGTIHFIQPKPRAATFESLQQSILRKPFSPINDACKPVPSSLIIIFLH